MNVPLLLGILSVPVLGGLAGTRIWARRREHGTINIRLARWTSQPKATAARTLLKSPQWSSLDWQFLSTLPGIQWTKTILDQSGLKIKLSDLLVLMAVLLFLPIAIALALDINLFVAISIGIVLPIAILLILKAKAGALRTKFCEQLPDAIDLMVAVLRSGHSIPQAIKAVSQEIPNPCGAEFQIILHRMNLGQPLWQSLILSAQRFRSYELDLIRRAVGIQAEVGGSLAELLDKTNNTLRDRLKLARQLRVVTAQSRLSAQIIGLIPIFLAFWLNFINPGYLQYLTADKLGQALLGIAISLEIMGIFILRRMSTMKV
jgi:tight adherence protein B